MRISLFFTIFLTVSVAILLSGCQPDTAPGQGNNGGASGTSVYPNPEPTHYRAYKKEGWALYIDYRAPGTRSEGIDGRIYHDGEVVGGKEVGETLDTPLGKMTWKGERENYGENFHPWVPTGWYSENPEHMRRYDREIDKKAP